MASRRGCADGRRAGARRSDGSVVKTTPATASAACAATHLPCRHARPYPSSRAKSPNYRLIGPPIDASFTMAAGWRNLFGLKRLWPGHTEGKAMWPVRVTIVAVSAAGRGRSCAHPAAESGALDGWCARPRGCASDLRAVGTTSAGRGSRGSTSWQPAVGGDRNGEVR